jgi:DNA-binding CsgD family transcriptional regulator
MQNLKHIIAIVSPSQVIQLGLSNVIREHTAVYQIYNFNDINGLQSFSLQHSVSVVIIDAGLISYNQKLITTIRKEFPSASWITLVYQFVNPAVLSQFDESITIDQGAIEIMSIINASIDTEKDKQEDIKTESLSERETHVLKLLVTGFSAKEIADRLNISVNTVISHRKNISQKTGIKSLAGLTIYAVTNKVISMSSLQR